MEPYVTFSEEAILEGATPLERSLKVQTWAIIPAKTQLAPTREPAEEPAPIEVSAKEPASPSVTISGLAEEPNIPHAA